MYVGQYPGSDGRGANAPPLRRRYKICLRVRVLTGPTSLRKRRLSSFRELKVIKRQTPGYHVLMLLKLIREYHHFVKFLEEFRLHLAC